MIDHTQIPETSLMDICAVLDGPLLKFYADPENMKAYETWLKERRKKNNG